MVVTVLKVGLKETEVLDSRQKYGSNKLTEVESEGFKKKLIKNLGDPMIKISADVAGKIVLVISSAGSPSPLYS